jgi:Flp pilus assembly protein TadD
MPEITATFLLNILKAKQYYYFLAIIIFSFVVVSLIYFYPIIDTSIQRTKDSSTTSSQAVQQYYQDLQTAWHKQPDNVQIATQLAKYYLQQGKRADRDLYLYLAQTTLQHWWEQIDAPAEVLGLRAHIYQAQHEFSLARADLQHLLEQQVNNPSATFNLAMLQQLQGDYSSALQGCKSLLKSQQLILSTLCQASVQSMTGQAQRAYKVLAVMLPKMISDAQWRQWTLTIMADIAARLGNRPQANNHFQQALAIPSQDAYLNVRYADFLLSQQSPDKLLHYFSTMQTDKALFLRQVHAAQLLERSTLLQHYQPRLRILITELNTGMQNAALDQHPALLAYYYLYIVKNASQALFFAKINWQKQKSSEDLYLLWRAALFTQDIASLHEVQQWRKQTQLEDIALDNTVFKQPLSKQNTQLNTP